MKNQVIQVLDKEHGKRVIEYWKSKGVDTKDMGGYNTKKRENIYRYYGVINGDFQCYSIDTVHRYNAEIIELPEGKPYPRVMFVSMYGDSWHKRVVFMKKRDRFLAWFSAETIEESEGIYEVTTWRYAKELPEKVELTKSEIAELTKSEIAEKFGISIDQLVIKND